MTRSGPIATPGKGSDERAALRPTHPGRAAVLSSPSISQAAGQVETVTILANAEGTTITLAAGASTLTTRVFAARFPDTTQLGNDMIAGAGRI